MTKRFLCFALSLISLVVMFCGCNQNKNEVNNETPSNNETPAQSTVTLSKDDVKYTSNDGASVYNIVIPSDDQLGEESNAQKITKMFKSLLGINIKTTVDSENTVNDYEILIGNTNRTESKQGLDYLFTITGGRKNDYVICTIGKKIVINAMNTESLANACDYLANNFIKADGIKGGLDFTYTVKGDFKDITINGNHIGRFSIVRPHFNTSYLTQTELDRLVEKLSQGYGYGLTIEEDTYTEPFEYEIVVGNNKRDGVKEITNHDEYIIKISGKKVYLNGGSAHATAMAVSEFGKLIEKGSITDSDSVVGSYETAMKNYDRKTTYYPVYSTDFDGDNLDTTKWRVMDKTEFGREGQHGKYSGMSDDPGYVYQKDGKFYIYGYLDGNTYRGGTLTTEEFMAFKFGYVEHSVLQPSGNSFWSLLWFTSTNDGTNTICSSEIDLNECFGDARYANANLHITTNKLGKEMGFPHHASFDLNVQSDFTKACLANRTGNPRYTCPDGKTWSDDFHTFGMIWDENHIAFTADGKVWMSYETTNNALDIDAFVNSYYYIKLSFSVGRDNNGMDIDEVTKEQWENTNVLKCDWIYLYQLDDGKQSLILK